MRIAVDGGALCSPEGKQFGTYRFSTELLRALSLYGKHDYSVYSFCDIDSHHQEKRITYQAVKPSFAWMKLRLPLVLSSAKPDVFLALNQALPFGFNGKKITFSHGLSFQFFPEYYKNEYPRLRTQLEDYCKYSDVIVVSSSRVKKEMKQVSARSVEKVKVLPFGIFPTEKKEKRSPKLYFLYVGSDQPIKNVSGLIHSFSEFWKRNRTSRIKLLLVGTERRDLPPFVEQIPHASHEELKKLYSGAIAYISCSIYESFNFPVLEALQANCPVVALESAIIPEQKPFVHAAENMEDLQFLLEKAAQGVYEKETSSELYEIFNWQHYVTELENLYI